MSVNRPASTTPPRQPNSRRRTSTLEVARAGESLLIRARARDLHTDDTGAGTVLDEVSLAVALDGNRCITTMDVDGIPTDAIAGAFVGPGFRRIADDAFPDAVGRPLGWLLDDLPIGSLLSGYAMGRDAHRRGEAAAIGDASRFMADVCAGWRSEGSLMTSIRRGRGVPFQDGPDAGAIHDGPDPLAWHDVDRLDRGTIRRARRLDVRPDGDDIKVDAFFRDSYGEPDGRETVLHEYGLAVIVDARSLVVRDAVADDHVLPYDECSEAVPSATQLIGTVAGEARRTVRDRCVGISSCTHLNDLLVTLSSVPMMLERAG
jgi:hypothetical protein